ncbi:MAG: hypothetical protein H3C34_03430 [Caldilineaceae bacterium]|nr:hypothetical protein [Caldilineaceae bacterium]
MEKPNRLLAALIYLLLPIGPLLVMLFWRRDKFTLFHACQALGLVLIAIFIPLGWIALGWTLTLASVDAPLLYLAPIALALAIPVFRRQARAARYRDRGSWLKVTVAGLVALALLYVSYLVVNWLTPFVLPLVGPLFLMSAFSLVMAGYVVLVAAWLAGLANALRARPNPVPVFGGLGMRLFARLA